MLIIIINHSEIQHNRSSVTLAATEFPLMKPLCAKTENIIVDLNVLEYRRLQIFHSNQSADYKAN